MKTALELVSDEKCRSLLIAAFRAEEQSTTGAESVAQILASKVLRETKAATEKEAVVVELLDAVQRGKVTAVLHLLDQKADVNAGDADGNTALHIAALSGYRLMVECRLDRKADVRVENSAGRPPIRNATGEIHPLLLWRQFHPDAPVSYKSARVWVGNGPGGYDEEADQDKACTRVFGPGPATGRGCRGSGRSRHQRARAWPEEEDWGSCD